MPAGTIALLVVAVLVYFGVAQRVLDRMRLTDRAALGFILAMIIGGFLNVTLVRVPAELRLNIGGGIVPLVLAGYLMTTADERVERWRALVAALVSGVAVYIAGKIVPPEEQFMVIDPLYVFSAVAGVVGYLAGRSRRSAFVAGTVGIVIADVLHYIELLVRRIPGRTWVGGAGAFDATVIAGLLAVVLAEVVGETREKLQGGTTKVGRWRGHEPYEKQEVAGRESTGEAKE
ncbi:MAG TPA: DUF1614 domain-containing protein [Firmicutes bacterium]|nr:DUF1614 domain-containing protein [Bacillota bacterium]